MRSRFCEIVCHGPHLTCAFCEIPLSVSIFVFPSPVVRASTRAQTETSRSPNPSSPSRSPGIQKISLVGIIAPAASAVSRAQLIPVEVGTLTPLIYPPSYSSYTQRCADVLGQGPANYRRPCGLWPCYFPRSAHVHGTPISGLARATCSPPPPRRQQSNAHAGQRLRSLSACLAGNRLAVFVSRARAPAAATPAISWATVLLCAPRRLPWRATTTPQPCLIPPTPFAQHISFTPRLPNTAGRASTPRAQLDARPTFPAA